MRLGVVRYLNTRPLIAGLESLAGLHLRKEVPAELIGTLERGETDAALCSSIDFQRADRDMVILPVGLLGCDGPTLTVQVFSQVPLASVRRLHADSESHTSCVLASILFSECFGTNIEIVDGVAAQPSDMEAVLLIGDKAVLAPPDAERFSYRMDLGEAWHSVTGLPFTFACWMAPIPETETARKRLETLSHVLDHQRRHNATRIASLAAIEGREHGWPADLSQHYLCTLLRFEWNASQQAGLELFWSKAAAASHLNRVKPLKLLEIPCRQRLDSV